MGRETNTGKPKYSQIALTAGKEPQNNDDGGGWAAGWGSHEEKWFTLDRVVSDLTSTPSTNILKEHTNKIF